MALNHLEQPREQEVTVARICTHLCRKIPGLKLNPRHCEARKSKPKGNIRDVFMFVAGNECMGCAGPILATNYRPAVKEAGPASIRVPEVIPEGAKAVAPATHRKRKLKPDICNGCGGKASDGVYFFASNPYTCARCVCKRSEKNKKKRSMIKKRIVITAVTEPKS